MGRIVLIASMFLFETASFAADSYQLNNNANQNITEHGVCKNVSNTTGQSLFIPTKSAAEWLDFRNNPPTNITLADCVAGYVNATTAGAASGDLTINVPAGTLADHVMIATVSVRPNTTTIATPTGWTLIRNTQQTTGTASQQATYRRVANGSEPANYVWTFSGTASAGAAGGISTFSGIDTTTPVDIENGQTTASSLSHATPSVTTTVADTMLVGSFQYGSTTNNWTPPGGMTEAVDAASIARPNGGGISMSMAYATQAAIGASGAKTATADGTGAAADTGATHLVALAPETVPTDVVVTMTGSTDNIVGNSVLLTGAATGAVEAIANNNNTGTAYISTNITTLTNNAWVVDAIGCGNSGTFTADGGQTERQDNAAASSSSALATKPVATAGATTVGQTHSTTANRLVHVALAVPPSGTIAYFSSFNGVANTASSLTWDHPVPGGTTGKLVVSISVEDPTCGGNQVVTSVVHGVTNLTFATSATSPAAGYCQHIEIWYMDVL